MKRILTLLLLFTITLFLSGNQVVITQNYNFIVSNQSTFNFSTGALTSDNRYQRTNKIAITNDKVLADSSKYHYAFFWDEADTYLGYYKTNRGVATSGTYLGQVNTQNIPLPLNAYSFALVRYDNNYVLVNGYTIKDLFIDNNLDYDDLPDFNEIPIPELNGLTLNEVFNDGNLIQNHDFSNGITSWSSGATQTLTVTSQIMNVTGNGADSASIIFSNNNVNLPIGTYFLAAKARVTNSDALRIELSTGNRNIRTDLNTPTINTDYVITAYGTTIAITNGFVLRHVYFNALTANNKTMLVDGTFGTYLISASNLGIDNLTKAQMDRYFELYQNPINWIYYKTDGNVSSRDNYYYAAGKNLWDFVNITNNARIFINSGTIETGQTGNLVSDFISIKPNTLYFANIVNASTARAMFAWYDENQNFISGVGTTGTTPPRSATSPSNAYFVRLSTRTDLAPAPYYLYEGASGTYEPYAAPTNLLNLTLLFGVGNEPNLATMNGYYSAYEEYLEYDFILPLTFANQTLSYEVFYFDDGVSSEIEQLGSILIFTLIGFTLMIFGFVSKRRIFNLLSIGAFVVLGFLLVEFLGFIIILFGLIFVNVYYTFFGEL